PLLSLRRVVPLLPVAPACSSNVAPAQPKRQKKRKTKVVDVDSSDHPGVNTAEAEVDFVFRTSVLIITSATTVPTADPAAIAKEKLVG
nr:hypothetical protein [Tanacetum cinerariifolium]